jgi:uncharacterized GH25 family protein
MKSSAKWLALPLCAALVLPASAHRAWLLPSATILSDVGSWVTVDAAVSNDLFYFEHFPLRLEGVGEEPEGMPERRGGGNAAPAAANAPSTTAAISPSPAKGGRRGGGPRQKLTILAPDGSMIEPVNGAMGRYRSTFDFPVDQKGTYKLAVVSGGLSAGYTVGGAKKRWRGKDVAELKKELPADAADVKLTEQSRRMETFVTVGAPSDDVLKPTGKGLEMEPITHPNDLFAGEEAKFRLLLDGKPAANAAISVVPGGIRYRDELKEISLKSGADGVFAVTWPEAGMYWLEAEVRDDNATADSAERRASYVATLEVMKP